MIKNLTELDIDLIDSNEAMLVLNNLPNVLKLNGRNTKDDDDEEEDNGEEEGFIDTIKNNDIDNQNMIHNDNININNVYNNEISNRNDYLHPQMEEIEEDKNLENNSNYVSSDNNNDNNILNNFNSYGAANEKEKTNGNKKMTRNIKNLNEKELNPKIGENNIESNTDGIFQPNSLLYDKIIANNSNKKNANLNVKQNIDIDADDKKIEKENESIYDLNNINSNNSEKSESFLIDISNEELNLLKVEKYNKNSEFISFMKDFCEMLNSEDYESSDGNRIQNNYLSKIKSINEKKGEIPNYYYFFLLQKKKIKMIQNMLGEILPYILNKCPELNKNDNLVKLNKELFNTIKDTKELINYLHSHIEEYNEKKGNENNTNEIIKEKDDKISTLEELNNKLLLKLKNIKEEQSEYERKLSKLEKENKLMTERILTKANNMINYSMTETQNTVPATERGTTTKSKLTNNSAKNNTSMPKTNKRLFFNNEILNTNFVNYYHPTGKTSPIKLSENTTTLENITTQPNYYLNTYGNNNNVKQHLISLKTLKDFINELYASKTEYDIKCFKYRLPRETLEEHMYTFLNKKYGLKNLIIEWAKNVITGIKYYSKKDSTVLLFGKIMRNEQEEDARFIIQKVSESIEELLLYYIKKQNPLKLFNEIKEIFEQKKRSELMEEEWKGIIYSIYEKEEAGEIERKIESFINKENEKKKLEMLAKYKNSRIVKKNNNKYNFNSNTGNNSYYLNTINSVNNSTNLHNKASNNSSYMNSFENINNNKLTRIEKYNMLLVPEERNILYTDFIKIVLDNHIRFRDKQLMNFVKLFKSVDTDKDGIINEEEFTELIQKMKIFKEEEVENRIIQYLGKIDPFDNQKITFSECVSFFSNEIITDNDINGNEKEISILEKVCFNTNLNGKINNEVNNNEINDNIPLMESRIDSNNNISLPLNKNVDIDNK